MTVGNRAQTFFLDFFGHNACVDTLEALRLWKKKIVRPEESKSDFERGHRGLGKVVESGIDGNGARCPKSAFASKNCTSV
jgi:hypothetical protein